MRLIRRPGRHCLPPGHRNLVAGSLIGVLALAGAGCIAVGLLDRPSARPPALAVEALGTSAGTDLPGGPVSGLPPGLLAPAASSAAPAPVRLELPSLGVTSSLLQLGQAADGSLEVPAPGPQYDRAGWYRYSPVPGALGPAVIAGHVDSAAAGPSVFFRLSSLRPGDTARVTRADGSVAEFAVDDVRRYPKGQFPTELVYGDTDHAALRLITCGGAFANGHYLDNIVVRASLVRLVEPLAPA